MRNKNTILVLSLAAAAHTRGMHAPVHKVQLTIRPWLIFQHYQPVGISGRGARRTSMHDVLGRHLRRADRLRRPANPSNLACWSCWDLAGSFRGGRK